MPSYQTTISSIINREIERLNIVLPEVRRSVIRTYSDEFAEGNLKIAEGKVQNLFFTIKKTVDYWVGELASSPEEEIRYSTSNRKILNLELMLNSLAENALSGRLGDLFPDYDLQEMLASKLRNIYPFVKSLNSFARYVAAWDYMSKVNNDSLDSLLSSEEAEAYALLSAYHGDGDFSSIKDSEIRNYLENVKDGDFFLPGLIKLSLSLTNFDWNKIIEEPENIKSAVKQIFSSNERQWRDLQININKGLNDLIGFLEEKSDVLFSQQEHINAYCEQILSAWVKNLINFQTNSLSNYAKNKKQRKQLSSKFVKVW